MQMQMQMHHSYMHMLRCNDAMRACARSCLKVMYDAAVLSSSEALDRYIIFFLPALPVLPVLPEIRATLSLSVTDALILPPRAGSPCDDAAGDALANSGETIRSRKVEQMGKPITARLAIPAEMRCVT